VGIAVEVRRRDVWVGMVVKAFCDGDLAVVEDVCTGFSDDSR
jgi:hypothetical protein